MAGSEGLAADRTRKPWPREAPRAEPLGHQRHTLATSLWSAVARCPAQIWQLEHDLSPVPVMERGWSLGSRRGDAGRDHGRQRPLQHRQCHSPRPRIGSGRKRGAHRRALGRSRGGFTSKLHCLADALGRPLAFHLTVGEAADCKTYEDLIDLPERAPVALLADKGYDADAIRADLADRKIEAVIPGRSNRRVKIEYDRALYKQRNRIERMFGHLKINRAIATRYDQLANSFLGMVHLATARYWLKFVHAA